MDKPNPEILRVLTPLGVLLTLLTVIQQGSSILAMHAQSERRLTTIEVRLELLEKRLPLPR